MLAKIDSLIINYLLRLRTRAVMAQLETLNALTAAQESVVQDEMNAILAS